MVRELGESRDLGLWGWGQEPGETGKGSRNEGKVQASKGGWEL